jgi:hypothetical protein
VSVLLGLLLYLGVGIGSEVLVTSYTILVGKGWASVASALSLAITLLNYWVIKYIFIPDPTWYGALAYAAGNAVGCFAIMCLSSRLHRGNP